MLTSKIDLSKLQVEHAFTVVKKDKSQRYSPSLHSCNVERAFYFSCSSEQECTEWVKVILLAQGWPKDEVDVFLQLDKEQKGTLRGGSVIKKSTS